MIRLNCSKEKFKRKELGENSFGYVGNHNSKWMSVYMNTGSLLNLDFVWHCVDMYYIHEHVFDRYNSWFPVMVWFFKELESLERWYMYVFNYKAVCLWQQGKVTGILYIYLSTNSRVFMVVWCRGLYGKRDCPEILKAQVELSLRSIGNPWGLGLGVCY